METKDINFEEELYEGVGGALTINNLKLPCRDYDPIAKIIVSWRRRIREKYDINAAAYALYNGFDQRIIVKFCLEHSWAEKKGEDPRIYAARYNGTFQKQVQDLEDILLAFVDDEENGLAAYKKLYEECFTDEGKPSAQEDLDDLLNAFLLSIGARTPKEQKRTLKNRAKAKEQATTAH
ncbi:hypothetical protein IKF88_00175 [Candidatus Saccharibacteria bacterium]|nr:hypothetical protein [Candidatus Saccharibacteria bacterium]